MKIQMNFFIHTRKLVNVTVYLHRFVSVSVRVHDPNEFLYFGTRVSVCKR